MKYKIPNNLLDLIMEEARQKNVSPFTLIEAALNKEFKESKNDRTISKQSDR